MADTTNLSIRIDRNLKNEADRMFNALGMNLTTAITVFVKQSVRQKRIPFEIALNSDDSAIVSLQDARIASERIWQNSLQQGTNKMTTEEINTEITASRAQRKAQKTSV